MAYAEALVDWYREASRAKASPYTQKNRILQLLDRGPLNTELIGRRLCEEPAVIETLLRQLAEEGKIMRTQIEMAFFWELNRPLGMKPICVPTKRA